VGVNEHDGIRQVSHWISFRITCTKIGATDPHDDDSYDVFSSNLTIFYSIIKLRILNRHTMYRNNFNQLFWHFHPTVKYKILYFKLKIRLIQIFVPVVLVPEQSYVLTSSYMCVCVCARARACVSAHVCVFIMMNLASISENRCSLSSRYSYISDEIWVNLKSEDGSSISYVYNVTTLCVPKLRMRAYPVV